MNQEPSSAIYGLAIYYTVTSAAKEVLKAKRPTSSIVTAHDLIHAYADMFFDVLTAFGDEKSTSEIEKIYEEHEVMIKALTNGL